MIKDNQKISVVLFLKGQPITAWNVLFERKNMEVIQLSGCLHTFLIGMQLERPMRRFRDGSFPMRMGKHERVGKSQIFLPFFTISLLQTDYTVFFRNRNTADPGGHFVPGILRRWWSLVLYHSGTVGSFCFRCLPGRNLRVRRSADYGEPSLCFYCI